MAVASSDSPSSLSSSQYSENLENDTPRFVAPHVVQHRRATRARRWINHGISELLDSTKSKFASTVKYSIDSTRKYEPIIPKNKPQQGPRELTVRLWKADTLHAAGLLKKWYPGDRIAVLNMANPRIPGGGLLNGSTAQEEVLCVRTTLHRTLRNRFYPLSIPDVILSPDVLVCRGFDGSFEGYEFPDEEKFNVDVISAAAIARPLHMIRASDGQRIYFNERDRSIMREGVQKILQAAVDAGARRMVLGAWGCGMFANPAYEVAAMIKVALLGTDGQLPTVDWARHGLEEIVIAIYDTDVDRGFPVWNTFLHVFGVDRRPLPSGVERLGTTEISHVLRWPDESAGKDASQGQSSEKGTSLSPPVDDSLFGSSGVGDTVEGAEDPNAAAKLVAEIGELIAQTTRQGKEIPTTGNEEHATGEIGLQIENDRPEFFNIFGAGNTENENEDEVVEILPAGIPRVGSPELPDYTSSG